MNYRDEIFLPEALTHSFKIIIGQTPMILSKLIDLAIARPTNLVYVKRTFSMHYFIVVQIKSQIYTDWSPALRNIQSEPLRGRWMKYNGKNKSQFWTPSSFLSLFVGFSRTPSFQWLCQLFTDRDRFTIADQTLKKPCDPLTLKKLILDRQISTH